MAAKDVVEQAEATLEVVEDQLDELETIKKSFGAGKAVGFFALGAAVGVGVTYFVIKKRLEATYDERVRLEVEESIEFLKTQDVDLEKVAVVTEFPEDEAIEVPEEVKEVMEQYDSAVLDPEPEPDTIDEVEGQRLVETKPDPADLVKKNQAVSYHKVFKDDAEKVAEAEVAEAARVDEPDFEDVNPDISVISRDLFMTNVSEYPQQTLTYFSDDAVLDIQGDFVADHENLIGTGRPPFGLQSEDENIVYLRNKKTEKEFEVIYDSGEAGEFLRHSLGEMYGRDRSR